MIKVGRFAKRSGPLLLLAICIACGRRCEHRPNLLLVIVDTLAADHLSCYGYDRRTAPTVDSLAGEGLFFQNLQAQAPWTLPAMASIYTGLTVRSHGCRQSEGVNWGLDPAVPTMATILSKEGFSTAGFVNVAFLGPVFGMSKGFDVFHWRIAGHGKAAQTVDEVIQWMDSEDFEEPFFLVFHVYDPHIPYEPPSPFDTLYCGEGINDHSDWETNEAGQFYPEQRTHLVDLYDSEIRWTDGQLSRLLGEIRSRGLADSTLLVFTADHGEEFLEHGAVTHGTNLYQNVIHVPMIICGPGIEPDTVSTVVGQYDILPTVLTYYGIEVPEHVEGIDLLGDSIPEERPVPSSGVEMVSDSFQAAVRVEMDKVIWSPVGDVSESFDLRSDPSEQNPIPTDSVMLQLVLDYWATPCNYQPTNLEAPLIQNKTLRDLGYIR
ncbi:sulfatase-like hydrolase/transferase [Candidatus Fermentibacteria bacterium]|nr:sulfatase-like hydrolase/transferase [Candidatus Fermentibacteria bacterium]